ncbi:MAG: hypothetical protein ACLRPW_13460 [Intestinibacter sp.]
MATMLKIGKPEAIDLIYNEIMKSYNEAVGSKIKKKNKLNLKMKKLKKMF